MSWTWSPPVAGFSWWSAACVQRASAAQINVRLQPVTVKAFTVPLHTSEPGVLNGEVKDCSGSNGLSGAIAIAQARPHDFVLERIALSAIRSLKQMLRATPAASSNIAFSRAGLPAQRSATRSK
jgi:hypothetical protein